MLQLPDVRPWSRLAISATGVSAVEQTEPSACEEHTAFPSDRHRVAVRTVGEGVADRDLAIALARAGARRAACLRASC